MAKAAVVNLKLLHPDWEYLFFDDTDIQTFIKQEFPQYDAVFKAFPRPIQRIDFFRYLAVMRLGGFYFDLDVFLSEPLSDLLGNRCIFPFEELSVSRYLRTKHDLDWEIGNYAFGATQDHPFLNAIVENCIRSQQSPDWLKPMMAEIPFFLRAEFAVLNSTGPGMVSRTYAENPEIRRDVTILFPDDVCDERNWHQFGRFGTHAMDGSWRERGRFIWRKAALFGETSTRRELHRESMKLGPSRNAFPNSVKC